MFKRILTPLDGSDFAEKALTHLPRFSDPAQTQFILLGVLETLRYPPTSGYAPLSDVNDRYTQYETYLQTRVEELQEQQNQAYFRLAEGDAAEKILEVAEYVCADLIAMATHGRSGVTRWALGSVAERVIHGATLPILLVREQTAATQEKIKRILVPLDGSALAEKALTSAEMLAKDTNAELLLFQAIPLTVDEYGFARTSVQTTPNPLYEHFFANADVYLNGIALRLRTAGLACQTMVLGGEPASLICDVVNESAVDLVAIGTHGRTGFKRWMYGSVANQVIRGVNCPVLVIPNTQTEKVSEPAQAGSTVPVAMET